VSRLLFDNARVTDVLSVEDVKTAERIPST
jgi:hypothetical protein